MFGLKYTFFREIHLGFIFRETAKEQEKMAVAKKKEKEKEQVLGHEHD